MNKYSELNTLQNKNRRNLNVSIDKVPSFRVRIMRYFTDVDGTILDKNSAAIPNFMKDKYPVFLFNAFDQAGGYLQGIRNLPPPEGTFFIWNETYKNQFPLLQFSGANNIEDQLITGDHFLVYSDSKKFPNIFVWFVLSVELRSYGSILKNPLANGMPILSVQYSADNLLQFNENLSIMHQNEIGNVDVPQITPLAFKTPNYQQDGFILLPMNNWRLTNYRGIYFYMLFETDSIDMIFRYIKE